jgi:hypothetical protein
MSWKFAGALLMDLIHGVDADKEPISVAQAYAAVAELTRLLDQLS